MEEPRVDPVSSRFVRVLEILATIGLVIMVIAGVAYFAGLTQCPDPQIYVDNWDKPANEFWTETEGIEAVGYAWFARNLGCASNVSILGIVVMMLAPLVAMIAVIPISTGLYLLFFAILIVEFAIAVARPLIGGNSG
jgi:hypothetical protein